MKKICPRCGAAFDPPHCPYCAQEEVGAADPEGYRTRATEPGEVTTLFQPRLLAEDGGPPDFSPTEARLRLLDSEPPRFILLRDATTVVGREEGDAQVADPSLDSPHFEIVRVEDDLVLRDLGSSSGTFLGDRRIRSSELVPGDLIRAGTSRFRFETGE
ncbi:MAG: FHA domain-containing protein [Thermoanaerobaculia bacterium]|nr:FHA domain-containing protein [Thermoanaerobaculia bacterium]